MNKNIVEEWLDKLKNYWFNKDIDSAVSLFTSTTFYQETPFMKPYTIIEEINQEWQHIKNENIQNIEFNVLAIDGFTVILIILQMSKITVITLFASILIMILTLNMKQKKNLLIP